MRSKTKIFVGAAVVSAFAAMALGVASGVMNQGNDLLNAAAGECSHKGYHYAENVASASAIGNAEFYACCACHETWLAADKPTGDFQSRAIGEAEGGIKEGYKYYYVVLDAKGGTGGSASINNATSTGNLPSITVPAKACYSFEGYYSAEEGGTQYIDASGSGVKAWDLGNNATLYAHWTLNHAYASVAEVPATTHSDGVAAHYECSTCHKLFMNQNGQYTETTADDLLIEKLPSSWNGDVNFADYCADGDASERVAASVVNSKLRFTMTAESHYGEYRSALYYNIKKSDNKKYYMSISGVTCSSGCDVATSAGYPAKLVIVVVNNGARTTVGDYYYPDVNYEKMDLTNWVMSNDDNDVQVIIQVVYGADGANKKDEYVDIEKITFTAEVPAPAAKTFETGDYDAESMMVGANTYNLAPTTNDGKLTMTVGSGDTWGVVTPVTVWTASSFEEAYMEVTVSDITSGAWMIFQLANIDGAEGEKYLNTDQNATGTYRIPLASNQCAGMTGSHAFKFRFGVNGGKGVSATISSIKLYEINNIEWNDGTDVNLAHFAFSGFQNDRVTASCVDNKLRLTKNGEYHYGSFTSDNLFNVNKEEGKTYTMTLSDISFSRDDFTYTQITIYYYVDSTYTASQFAWTHAGDFSGSTDPIVVDFTNKLGDVGHHTLQLAIQIVLGKDGETVTGYVDIGRITLSVQ